MADEEDERTTGLLSGLLSGPSRHTLSIGLTDPVLVDDEDRESEHEKDPFPQ